MSSAITPKQGATGGGTSVIITGINFTNAIAVNFGTRSGVITANTDTQIVVTSPPGFGNVDVTVVTNAGTSNPISFFYIEPPTIFSISTNSIQPAFSGTASGPIAGGANVYINGVNLATTSQVTFSGLPGTLVTSADGQIVVTVPAGVTAGSANIIVYTLAGTASGLTYQYIDLPTLSSLTPSGGSTSGGTTVTIKGTNLLTTTSVTFNTVNAAFAIIDKSTVVAITPAGVAGVATVVLATTGGSEINTGGFTYADGPVIESAEPPPVTP